MAPQMSALAVAALSPIVLLIFGGWALRQRRVLTAEFWPQAERLCYFILLPALLFHSLASAKTDRLPITELALVLVGGACLTALLMLAARPLMRVDGPSFTSIFQGGIRFNNYVGLTLAAGLFGTEGVALAAICNAVIVPTVNVLCVLVFARFGSVRMAPATVLRQLVTNPLILASIAGITFHLLGLGLPPGVEPALRALGAAALPLGLLCVGAALEFSTARQWIRPVALSSAVKFVLLPLITAVAVSLAGLTGPALLTAVLFQSLPTASSSYILARQLGGNAPLMAGITAVQTVLAMAVLPLVLILVFPLAG